MSRKSESRRAGGGNGAAERDDFSEERHAVRELLVDGHINGLEFLKRMRDIDEMQEAANRRRFAIYMRMLEKEKEPSTRKKTSLAESQHQMILDLMVECEAKMRAKQSTVN